MPPNPATLDYGTKSLASDIKLPSTSHLSNTVNMDFASHTTTNASLAGGHDLDGGFATSGNQAHPIHPAATATAVSTARLLGLDFPETFSLLDDGTGSFDWTQDEHEGTADPGVAAAVSFVRTLSRELSEGGGFGGSFGLPSTSAPASSAPSTSAATTTVTTAASAIRDGIALPAYPSHSPAAPRVSVMTGLVPIAPAPPSPVANHAPSSVAKAATAATLKAAHAQAKAVAAANALATKNANGKRPRSRSGADSNSQSQSGSTELFGSWEEDDDDDVDNKLSRVMRNREAAKKSRYRKKEYVDQLELEIQNLKDELLKANSKVQRLEVVCSEKDKQVVDLKSQVADVVSLRIDLAKQAARNELNEQHIQFYHTALANQTQANSNADLENILH